MSALRCDERARAGHRDLIRNQPERRRSEGRNRLAMAGKHVEFSRQIFTKMERRVVSLELELCPRSETIWTRSGPILSLVKAGFPGSMIPNWQATIARLPGKSVVLRLDLILRMQRMPAARIPLRSWEWPPLSWRCRILASI